jgi:hypothetical protein
VSIADLRERFDVVFDTSSVVKAPFARRQASTRDLAEIARLIDVNEAVLPPVEGFDVPDAPRAFERVERGGVIGKVVLRIPDAGRSPPVARAVRRRRPQHASCQRGAPRALSAARAAGE